MWKSVNTESEGLPKEDSLYWDIDSGYLPSLYSSLIGLYFAVLSSLR